MVNKIERPCAYCGKTVLRSPSDIRRTKKSYCSVACTLAAKTEHWMADSNPNWVAKTESQCVYCGKVIVHSVNLHREYCSKKCFDDSRKQRITRVCAQCGKEFERIPANLRQHAEKFCSRECMGISMSLHRTGANNPCWKGGKDGRPSANPSRQSEYYHQRRAREGGCTVNDFTKEQWLEVLEAFNYHCAYCLKPLDAVDREHMTPISRGGDNTLSNIVPSCRSCNVKKNDRTLLEYVAAGGFHYIGGVP
jgi:endogenous inhibitor of DNA gyrase (YacG/DUF329 family)